MVNFVQNVGDDSSGEFLSRRESEVTEVGLGTSVTRKKVSSVRERAWPGCDPGSCHWKDGARGMEGRMRGTEERNRGPAANEEGDGGGEREERESPEWSKSQIKIKSENQSQANGYIRDLISPAYLRRMTWVITNANIKTVRKDRDKINI